MTSLNTSYAAFSKNCPGPAYPLIRLWWATYCILRCFKVRIWALHFSEWMLVRLN